ncbi:glycosyltransferase [Halomonas vilamensis]|uniref:Glycosyltransferase n=1 Tax=Vreelandella vilamensis TaxID=531309 RepID=A0ABU1H0X8_9GAMM|nr:glycosyltransferase [Halomonas vilamensis]MDR5897974.1 glycosyltransferase [Halomonas vilamensis]
MSERLTLVVAGDPAQRTGGYHYDAHIVYELREAGWQVDVVGLEGRFPDADSIAENALGAALAALPDGRQVIIDGLAMGALPEVIVRHHARINITALVHHPLGDEQGLTQAQQAQLHQREMAALATVARIIVTSHFTRRRLKTLAAEVGVRLAPINVVEPGVTPAPLSEPSVNGPLNLLCVATVTPRKGQDILTSALGPLSHLDWQCDCYGSNERNPEFAKHVATLIDEHELNDSLRLHGECDSAELEAAYQRADVLVLPSWYEGYGMVVTEALARGVPVITTTGGALNDTLPDAAGLKVPPGDSDALTAALTRFLTEPLLRERLRRGARQAREKLNDWQTAGEQFARMLQPSPPGSHFAADWLALREPVDANARSQHLVDVAATWLMTDRPPARKKPLEIVDLGCGRGSNVCFLAPLWHGSQRWQLIDHDPALLQQARKRCDVLCDGDIQPITVQTLMCSLIELPSRWPAQADVISASALLDLVSAEWLDVLVARCAEHRQALFIALSVTGEWHLSDRHGKALADADDKYIETLFNAHQQRDKGFGAALGGRAHGELVKRLNTAGFYVEEAASPWRLNAGQAEHIALLHPLFDGWAQAALEQAPEAEVRIDAWRAQRLAQVDAGELGAFVDHRDLWARPAHG